MLSASRLSVWRLRKCEITAMLAACVIVAGITDPMLEAAGQDARTATESAARPIRQSRGHHQSFRTELGRLARGRGFPRPTNSPQQAEANKTCTVATLPDPGKKLDAQTIYARARAGIVIIGAIPKAEKRHHPHRCSPADS